MNEVAPQVVDQLNETSQMERFSDTVMAHFQDPSNRGRLENPDGVGLIGSPGAGPFFLLGVNLVAGRVTTARFECHGCGALIACGSVLTELVIGRDLSGCEEITAFSLTEALDGLPPDKRHWVDVAIVALRQAIAEANRCEDLQSGKNAPSP